MTDPITPPPELVQQWRQQWWSVDPDCEGTDLQHYIATQAAQWGWDQRGAATEAELQKARDEELEACCEWIRGWYGTGCGELISELRAARRPNPPSLKKQALRELGDVYNDEKIDDHVYDTIRRALEQLDG